HLPGLRRPLGRGPQRRRIPRGGSQLGAASVIALEEEWLRYTYMTGDRETLLEFWLEITLERGYLCALENGKPRELGPREIEWLRKQIQDRAPSLWKLIDEGPHPNA